MTEIARKVFADDKYATDLTGVNIDLVKPHEARCSLILSDKHRNARGAVMGGVYFALADFAFAIAVNSMALENASVDQKPALQWISSSATVHFLAPAKGDKISAVAKCIRHGRSNAVYQTIVNDDEGNQVALVTTSAVKI